MPYGRVYTGDYGRAMGDPGFFDTLKRIGGGIVKTLAPAPIRIGISALERIKGRGRGQMLPGLPATARIPVAAAAAAARGMKGGKTTASGAPRKRRRMNVANPKALRKAIRRQDGFVKLARRALKGSGYTIVSRSSRARRVQSIRESGPGSVNVR